MYPNRLHLANVGTLQVLRRPTAVVVMVVVLGGNGPHLVGWLA
jgi:hypothetical protein